MTPRAWTTGEIRVIKTFAGLGASVIADLLERPVEAVEEKAKYLHVSLTVTNDDVDIEWLPTRLLARIKEVPDLAVCPMCGKRLANMREAGICRCCYLDQLIALREEQLAEEIRLRKLTKLRQDKRRMRICDSCGDAFYPRATSTNTRCADCGGSE